MARPDPSELRSRREERNLNGVKNLLGAKPSPKYSFIITDYFLIKENDVFKTRGKGLTRKVQFISF